MKKSTVGVLVLVFVLLMFVPPTAPPEAEASRITARYGAPKATLRRGYLTILRRDAKILQIDGQRYYLQDGVLFQPAYHNGRLVYVPVGRL
ncbi:MAG: hypothetical protein AAF591_09555 [Verrucomicrobiota bacterium]